MRFTYFPLALAAASLCTPPARAQFAFGDLGLTVFNGAGTSPIEHYHADGTWVQTISGAPAPMKGAAFTADGLFVATSWQSPCVTHLYDVTGGEVSSFPMPEVLGITGDVSIFADGVFAVCDPNNGKIELYTPAGAHQGTISGLTNPIGTYVDHADHLWISDIIGWGSPTGVVFEFDRQGNVIQSFPTSFPPGDLVVAPDDTVWIPDRSLAAGGENHHLANDGTPLGSFSTAAGAGWAIALMGDGTLYSCGDSSSTLEHFDASGNLLGTSPIPSSGANLFAQFLAVRLAAPPVGSAYCFGDGSGTACPCVNNNNGSPGGCDWGDPAFTGGGVLDATGSASIAANDTFLIATNISNDFGIFFGADNQVNGGNGNPLNDGLRCAGGGLVRLIPPTMASGNQMTLPAPLQTLDTSAVGGATRRYQYWFRTPGGPCGQMANLTSGYEISWMP